MDIENVVKKAVKNRENVYFIGIKGAGTSALAELLHGAGVRVSGSDTDGVFYTCAILDALKIPYFEGFDPLHIASKRPDLVIHSAAYAPETNAEMAETLRRGIPLVKYTDALGAYSAMFDSSGVAGVHGKSTTTAIAGTLLAAAGLPAKILAGSATANFGGRSTITVGDKYFVAETCEYRKHFLKFRPRRVLLTGVESDHQDFFPTYESMLGAFVEYGENIESGGELIYCADDAGARETADILRKKRNDIKYTAYGFGADGFFNIKNSASGNGESVFELSGIPVRWAVRVPGRHTVLNSAGAIALVKSIADAEGRRFDGALVNAISRALREFSGCKRRSEIIGEAGGILFMDDYAHHPTAIKTTLAGLKDFYPGRRLVASFMAHTYSRTAAMLSDFARSFESADVVFLHRIYASAREVNDGKVSGRLLFEKTRALHGDARYADDPLDAAGELKTVLREGDLFITLGAGDNWKLCDALFDYYSNREAAA
ncbi:MAG: UDP-N-acetylmuramate--L-alanine ligase [Spirochaetaceae bacterium]|jgi:UDP-N-acetylmuramate--alanine ligase|nr:UDP-N-acetylmuramate--L-alanine ligase [Spirochaetaceae bacterium]